MELEEPHFFRDHQYLHPKSHKLPKIPKQLFSIKKVRQQGHVNTINWHESAVMYATFYRRDTTKLWKVLHKNYWFTCKKELYRSRRIFFSMTVQLNKDLKFSTKDYYWLLDTDGRKKVRRHLTKLWKKFERTKLHQKITKTWLFTNMMKQ